ncbi:MAG: CRISPR-associated protein Csx20 [Arcobacteraceae bacterium]
MFLLFSHKLSSSQIIDAKKNLKVENFIELNLELQEKWSNIPTDIETLNITLNPYKKLLKEEAKEDDIVLIQGDFGAVYHMVNFAKSLRLKAVYATTNRLIKEYVEDNKTVKKSIFTHVRFREYK